MRKGGGLGILMLVVVMAVVLLLVARQWRAVAGTAAPAMDTSDLPDLSDMRKATDDRSREVQDAMAEVE